MKKIILPLTLASIILVIFGSLSKPFLGDEIYHLRFAKDAYYANARPIFDSLYQTMQMPTILYTSPPFWNLLLALLWKLTGGVSLVFAQIYQSLYYVLLVIFTYLIGKELYPENEALMASFFVATVPMAVSFSILLYTDVPAVALMLVSIFFLIKKYFCLSGIFLGSAVLTKNNTAFLTPAIITMILFLSLPAKDKAFKRIRNLIIFLLPFFVICILDFSWKVNNIFHTSYGLMQKTYNIQPKERVPIEADNIAEKETSKGNTLLKVARLIAEDTLYNRIIWNTAKIREKGIEYLNSNLFRPRDLLMYFGFPICVFFIFSILRLRYRKNDVYLILFIASYCIGVIILIGLNTDIRYILPIAPFVCLLIARCATGNNNWVKKIIIFICIAQFISVCFYVYSKRKISPFLKEAFDFIKAYTPENSLIMYPEPNIEEYAGRKLIWSNFRPPTTPSHIFWPCVPSRIDYSIKYNGIDYIVIKKTRIYDDARIHHIGGYPASFVARLKEYNFLELIFENKEVSVWKVKKELLRMGGYLE